MASVSKPTMVRGIWEENGEFFNLSTAITKLLPNSSEKRKLLKGSTISNSTSSARAVTFYLPPVGVYPTDQHIVGCDFPLSNRETLEIPTWFIPPGRELWADTDGNNAVTALLTWKVESVR